MTNCIKEIKWRVVIKKLNEKGKLYEKLNELYKKLNELLIK